MREIILDTETTGLDPKSGHKIIEIGALEMINHSLTGKKFHIYTNPQRDVPIEAYRVHGISEKFLQDKPLFSDIAVDFIKFVDNSRLVIHNADFDIGFLNHELTAINMPSLDRNNVIDTLKMARKAFPSQRVNLDALCKRFKIDNSSRTFHGALKDAALLADVYVELCGGKQVTFAIFKKDDIDKQNLKDKEYLKNRKGKISLPSKEEYRRHREFMKEILR